MTKLSTKDSAGALLVLGTFIVLAVHNSSLGHGGAHGTSTADAGGSVTTPVGEPSTAFVDFNVLPMDRDVVLRRQVVIVRGGFIERVGPVGVVEPPAGAVVVRGDGSGYLAPGLVDAHVHLRGDYVDWLPLFLANGVTTVFNLEGNPRHLELRQRIRAGLQEGPTVYTAGPYVNEPRIRTAADARAEVSRQASRGYDFIKIHGELSEDAYAAVLATADESGMPVLGHIPERVPFDRILDGGQVGIAHAEELLHTRLRTLDERQIEETAAELAASGKWLIPTLVHFESIADQWASPDAVGRALGGDAAAYLPQAIRSEWANSNPFVGMNPADRARVAAMYAFHVPLIRAVSAHGVPLLAGTDTPIPALVPGFSLRREVEALREAGLSGYGALATATSNPGRFVEAFVDPRASFGTIRAGARADLVMLSGDPRADLSALERPLAVMARGRLYDRAELDRMLDGVRSSR